MLNYGRHIRVFEPRFLSPPPQKTKGAAEVDKKRGSNIIMSTSFALKYWFNNVIDVDIIPFFTLINS